MRSLRYMLPILLLAGAVGAAHAEETPGVVSVSVTYQEYDAFMPWQKQRPGTRSGYGILVTKDSVLVPESLVRNHELIELLKPRSGTRLSATIVMADPQIDLALLRVDDPQALSGMAPLIPATNLATDAHLELLQFDETSELQRLQATVEHVAMLPLPDAPYRAFGFSLRTNSGVDGHGGPALLEGKLAGMIIDYDNDARTATMLPVSTLTSFIADIDQPPYRGFATAGFFRQALNDPAKRAYLGMKDNGKGVLIVSTLSGSPAGEAIKANDVLIEWDGFAIDDMGFYEDPDYGRIDFAYLIRRRRQPGDMVPVKVVRDGKETALELRLERRQESLDYIPANYTGEREEYLIEGGFVIRELTGNYLGSFGKDWMMRVDSRLARLYATQNHNPPEPGARVVILAGVLDDPVNIGYQQLRNQVITAVNGQPVSNMKDIFKIAKQDGKLERISLKSVGVDIVIDGTQLPEANARLARLYRVPSLRYQKDSD